MARTSPDPCPGPLSPSIEPLPRSSCTSHDVLKETFSDAVALLKEGDDVSIIPALEVARLYRKLPPRRDSARMHSLPEKWQDTQGAFWGSPKLSLKKSEVSH